MRIIIDAPDMFPAPHSRVVAVTQLLPVRYAVDRIGVGFLLRTLQAAPYKAFDIQVQGLCFLFGRPLRQL